MAMLPSKCTSPEPCETIPMDIEANGAAVIWLEDLSAGREMGNSRCACIEGGPWLQANRFFGLCPLASRRDSRKVNT